MIKAIPAGKKSLPLFALTLLSAAISSQAIAEQSDAFKTIITDSTTKVDFRYRFEGVDQDGIDKDAKANTLRSRINWTSGSIGNVTATLEFDDVRAIGSEHYNSTSNGHTEYPAVADPEGTEVNQAYLKYKNGGFAATGGRQRINLDDQRFVGGVGWRQNEQTFDAGRLQYNNDIFTADYSYTNNINRIFGPEGDKANLKGDIHLINGSVNFTQNHKLTAFGYGLDFDKAVALSSNTYGLRYSGDLKVVKLLASYARQSDTGDNPTSYDADYGLVEASGKIGKNFGLKAGYEILGSDNGVKAFNTPLATLHKFQGFADKFLNTPNSGVKDAYLGASAKAGPVTLKLAYHDFKSDEGSDKLGTEWDAAAIYPINKNIKALLKYADYSADDHATDTKKVWLQLQLYM